MTERKAIKYDLIAGVLFAVLALHALTGISFSGILYNSFPVRFFVSSIIGSLIFTAGFGIVSFSMFTKRRDILPCIGFCVLALVQIVNAVLYVVLGLRSLLALLSYISAALVSLALLTPYLPSLKEYAKKFWYVPSMLYAVSAMFNVFYIIINIGFFRFFSALFWDAVTAGALLIACAWYVYPGGIPNTLDARTFDTNNFGGAFDADEEDNADMPNEFKE